MLSSVFVLLYTFRTAGAWVLNALTLLYTFRTAGAADLVNSNLFRQVLYNEDFRTGSGAIRISHLPAWVKSVFYPFNYLIFIRD